MIVGNFCPGAEKLRAIWYRTCHPVGSAAIVSESDQIKKDKESEQYQKALKNLRHHIANCPTCQQQRQALAAKNL